MTPNTNKTAKWNTWFEWECWCSPASVQRFGK